MSELKTLFKNNFQMVAKNSYQMRAFESLIAFLTDLERQAKDKDMNEVSVFAPNYSEYEHIKAYRAVLKQIETDHLKTVDEVKATLKVLISSILS